MNICSKKEEEQPGLMYRTLSEEESYGYEEVQW
jgi:hypothetical protein